MRLSKMVTSQFITGSLMRSFVREYFDDKSPDELRAAITSDWSDENTQEHLGIIAVPDTARSVYEIGAGIGRLLKPLCELGHTVGGCDASLAMVKEADGRLCINLTDGGGRIPEIGGTQDFVFSIICFQHIPDTATVERYIADAYRILRPGGSCAFQVLAEDLKPGRELWTYHAPERLSIHMSGVGFGYVITERHGIWTVLRGRKPS